MIERYLLENRKTSFVIRLYIFIVIVLVLLIVCVFNYSYYTTFYNIHSNIIRLDNDFYLKLKVDVSDVSKISSVKQLTIDDKVYNYDVYKMDYNIVDDNNSVYIYLFIYDLEDGYKYNNYSVYVKIFKCRDKVINFLIK